MAAETEPEVSRVEQYAKARLVRGGAHDRVEVDRVFRDFRLWADSKNFPTTVSERGQHWEMNVRDFTTELMALGYRIQTGTQENLILNTGVDWNFGHSQ